MTLAFGDRLSKSVVIANVGRGTVLVMAVRDAEVEEVPALRLVLLVAYDDDDDVVWLDVD